MQEVRLGAIAVPARRAQPAVHGNHQQEHDADGREIAIPGKLVLAVRIDHGDRGRQGLGGLMVVGHDHVEAGLGGGIQRRVGGRAAIDGDDEVRALGLELEKRRRVRAVAFLLAIRDIGQKPAADRLEEALQERRRGRAVDIVIAEHGHGLAAHDRLGDSVCRLVHVEEDGGIGQCGAQARVQIGFGLLDTDTPPDQHPAHDVGNAESLGQRQGQTVVRRAGAPEPAGEGLANAEKGGVGLRGRAGCENAALGQVAPQLRAR